LAQSLLVVLLAVAVLCGPAVAKKRENPPLPDKILRAKTVFLDCDCRREMAGSVKSVLPTMLEWGRYQVIRDRSQADLILLFSMNPYRGDYFTRDGPDPRSPVVDFTILTIIDGHTGEGLWTESKRWGYMLVSRASRALVRDFRLAVETQVHLGPQADSR